jgi:hypothetical protein
VIAAIAAAVRKLSTKAGGTLERILFEAVGETGLYVQLKHLPSAKLVPRGKTVDDLMRHLAWVCFSPDDRGAEELTKLGKSLGVNVEKIVAAHQPKPEGQAAQAKAAPAKKSATKKAPAKKATTKKRAR